MPAMRVTGQGFGAGASELEELPNCTQVVTGVRVERTVGTDLVTGGTAPIRAAGWAVDPDGDAGAGQPVAVLSANVDDATGEQLAHAVGALLDAGAHDAWLAPVIMKKGRPGTVVHVLADPSQVVRLRGVLRDTTGTLGVRVVAGERWPAARSVHSVWVDGQMIRVKVAAGKVKAEYEDVARVSRRTGISLRELAFRAEARWRDEQAEDGAGAGDGAGDPGGFSAPGPDGSGRAPDGGQGSSA
jgi:uncharacterized protein (DUF111 family)